MTGTLRPLAVSMGDPAGIGPDITLMAWRDRVRFGLSPFYVTGDPDVMERRAAELGLGVPVAEIEPEEAIATFPYALPVIRVGTLGPCVAGQPSSDHAQLVIAAIKQSVAHVNARRARAVITNPIAKSVLATAGFRHPGHTEYLAVLAEEFYATGPLQPVMLIWSEPLAVVPVTVHVPLARVPEILTTSLIVETARITVADYKSRFGVESPRLALCGLNPHAGEGGLLGHEDDAVIRPAVEMLRAMGIAASGPFPADTLFHADARSAYDVALGMYHDQVLTPVKTLAFDDGVNCTLGLPFVRTSPDHGTAFSIAGTGRARPTSLVAAIQLADRLSRAA